MEGLCYVIFIIFSLLSCAPSPLSYASPATFSRRHLLQAPPTDPSTFSPPFFPLYSSSSPPSPPPPQPLPPPAPTFATFPANISALVLPRSPKPQTSSRTLLIPAISAVLAVATLIALAFFLYGRWRGQIRHFKDESKSLASDQSQQQTLPCPPPRNNTTENKLSVAPSTSDVLYLGNVVTSSGSGFVKPESPEISPLPPLPARSFLLQHNSEANLDEEEEEDDDFYSPLASVAGQESRDRRINPYSNCSCSISSHSDSPAMSPSATISPPMNSTAPHWSSTQNPQSPSSPERTVRNNKRYGGASLRMFSLWNQNLGFPRISSASTSPERGMIRTPDAYARSSMYSSVSTTPDRFFRKVLDSSPPRWNDFSRNVKSLFLSSTSASPARDFCINISESSRSLKSSWENAELHTTEQGESAAPAATLPPPQRPPPAMPEPPPLVPPSQSFMVQKSGKKLSFSELPQSCWEGTTERPKPKLKPLPWDKVRPSSRRKTTWDRLPYNSSNANSKQRSLSCDLPMLNQESKVLDPRKSQNVAILLTTLKLTTNDVCQALRDGHYDALGVELLESLARVAPSEEEEKKLISYSDDSVIKLGPSERFLNELLNVPFVFKRVDALLSVASFDSKAKHLNTSFGVIQAACEALRNSRMLLRLVGATLETGMKSGNAHDFKLEVLLKLVNIKSLDGRTSILDSVVQKITESEGIKGLQVVRNLSSVLDDVKKSAELDYGVLRSDVSKLYEEVQKISEVLLLCEEAGHNEEHQWWKFRESMTRFLETAAEEIKKIEREEGSTLLVVKKITEYFHVDPAKEEAQLLKVFVIVRDFLKILEGVCKNMEVTSSTLA
ncbi:Formin FH2 domain [Arabidopsis thaliana x Arabidopsis arenosa]|uniref:Formin-like protein n=1 Tax=Arabidopsis thaliana x Arabidopsis arenosa TaxID=1240361 RepID=A0A8T2AQJ7_9BRAS|nr:Formin FH2 domain [Arabidopsis thaliana x Arabidopsis arenosa]